MSTTNELQGIWTQYGQGRMAEALAGGNPLVITHAAVGSGNGTIPVVSPSQEGLVSEEWRGLVNSIQKDPINSTNVLVDVVLPNNVGGFWIREWGLFDDAGKLVALGPHSEFHKSLITSGQTSEILERFHLPVSNSGAIHLSIATQALATQGFVQAEMAKLKLQLDAVAVSANNALVTAQSAMQWDTFLCRHIFKFIDPEIQPGMIPTIGTLVANASVLHPQAFSYLQTPQGQELCTTEAKWQADHNKVMAMLAAGTQITWNNIGGVCKYVIDTNAGTIRVPDLRGMYEEIAGFDLLGVGDVHGDAQRRLFGEFGLTDLIGVMTNGSGCTGPFATGSAQRSRGLTASNGAAYPVRLDSSLDTPTASQNQPRAWGSLGCVFLGHAS